MADEDADAGLFLGDVSFRGYSGRVIMVPRTSASQVLAAAAAPEAWATVSGMSLGA